MNVALFGTDFVTRVSINNDDYPLTPPSFWLWTLDYCLRRVNVIYMRVDLIPWRDHTGLAVTVHRCLVGQVRREWETFSIVYSNSFVSCHTVPNSRRVHNTSHSSCVENILISIYHHSLWDNAQLFFINHQVTVERIFKIKFLYKFHTQHQVFHLCLLEF